jgi:hypothetical protein
MPRPVRVLAFDCVHVEIRRRFILRCLGRKFLSRNGYEIIMKELAKLERAENRIRHAKSVVERVLDRADF